MISIVGYNEQMILTFTVQTGGELLIKVGQKVDFSDPLIKTSSSEEVTIPLASSLNVQPDGIFKTLKRFVGDQVTKGELIAESKGLLTTKKYHSEHDGIIKEVNHNDGSLVLEKTAPGKNTVNCFFRGEVTDIKGNTISLKVEKSVEYPLKEASHDFGGPVYVLSESKLGEISSDEVEGKIVLAERILPYEQVKLETLGLSGFVTLHSYSQDTVLERAVLKQISDWESIKKQSFSYCIISKERSTIYFYA